MLRFSNRTLHASLFAVLLFSVNPNRANATAVQVAPGSPLIDVTLTEGQPIGADIADLLKYEPAGLKDIDLLNRLISHRDPRLFQPGETLKGMVHLQDAPMINGDLVAVYPMVALMSEPEVPAPLAAPGQPQEAPIPGAVFFRKFNVTVSRPNNKKPRLVTAVDLTGDVPIENTKFSVEVGLISRMVVLEDDANLIYLTFPIGDGGLDLGIMGLGDRILTPLFQNAVLQRATVQKARTFPAYYRGEPYMPITSQHGIVTGVAFHITILEDADWKSLGPNYLIRGFDSHGCMRLRLKDLREFFTIVEQGGSDALPVNVDYFVWEKDQTGTRTWNPANISHPYPLRVDGYMAVENFADQGQKPKYERDPKEHLVVLENTAGEPDLRHLVGMNGDEATDLHEFDDMIDDHHFRAIHLGGGVVAHPGGLDQGDDNPQNQPGAPGIGVTPQGAPAVVPQAAPGAAPEVAPVPAPAPKPVGSPAPAPLKVIGPH